VSDDDIAKAIADGKYRATDDFAELGRCDVIVICVPTPLRKTKDPDISYIVSAVDSVKQHIRPPALIVLESTTYPGTTDELVVADARAGRECVGGRVGRGVSGGDCAWPRCRWFCAVGGRGVRAAWGTGPQTGGRGAEAPRFAPGGGSLAVPAEEPPVRRLGRS